MKTTPTKLVVLMAALVLVGAACSKKSNTPTTSGSSGTTASATPSEAESSGQITIDGKTANDHGTKTVSGGSLEVELDNFYFNPTTIKGPAGSTVKLELKNESGTKHNFTLEDQKINQDLSPHQDVTVTVTIPQSGTLQFHCEYHESS